MMNSQKIVFLDIDGTVYSHQQKKIPDSAIAAIQKAKEAGILLYGCTGRHRLELEQLHVPIHLFQGWVSLNGACCFDEKETFYRNPISHQDIEKVLATIQKYDYPCIFLEEDRMYINKFDVHVQEEMDRIHTPYPTILSFDELARNPVLQVIPYVDETLWPIVFANFRHVHATRWTEYALDVVNDTVGKDGGMKAVLNRYGIVKEHAYAIGDGPNDVAMVKAVGTCIAMGNAVDALKDVSHHISKEIDEDGLSYAFEQWIL